MKILLIACFLFTSFCNTQCFADEGTKRLDKTIMLNLSLVPRDDNFPTFDKKEDSANTPVSLELMVKVLGRGYNLSKDEDAPVLVRVRPHGVSIRFEWKF